MHARGQVAHADIPAAAGRRRDTAAAQAGRGLLPPDVRVRRIAHRPGRVRRPVLRAVAAGTAYRVCDDPAAADPLRRHDTLWYRRPLDVAAMNEAARACLGEHDFAAFCRRREGASTVRELLRLDWDRPSRRAGGATVVADAFCHNMVRALVGALLEVGDGARPPGWPAGVLWPPRCATRRCRWWPRTGCAWRRSATPPSTSPAEPGRLATRRLAGHRAVGA